MPVILVFTKFDMVVSQIPSDTSRDDAQQHERARAMALAMYEDSCRRLFQKDPRDVPAEIISGTDSFSSYASYGDRLTSSIVLRGSQIRRFRREASRDVR